MSFKICVVKSLTENFEFFVAIKPSEANFEGFLDAVHRRFPDLADAPHCIYYQGMFFYIYLLTT